MSMKHKNKINELDMISSEDFIYSLRQLKKIHKNELFLVNGTIVDAVSKDQKFKIIYLH